MPAFPFLMPEDPSAPPALTTRLQYYSGGPPTPCPLHDRGLARPRHTELLNHLELCLQKTASSWLVTPALWVPPAPARCPCVSGGFQRASLPSEEEAVSSTRSVLWLLGAGSLQGCREGLGVYLPWHLQITGPGRGWGRKLESRRTGGQRELQPHWTQSPCHRPQQATCEQR